MTVAACVQEDEEKMYYVALIAIVLIFIWRISVGFKRGMVKEIISLIATAVGGLCVVLILSAVSSYMDKEIGQLVQVVVALLVICLAYRLAHILLTSIGLVAKLPVIKGLDKVLGAVVGFVEAGVIVGLLVHLLKNWGLSALL